jgi:CubicO group peptidase (beta-lactamase class C family)
LLCTIASSVRAQEAKELEVGTSLEGQVSAGERSAFLVHLEANQVLFGEVDQKSLDIVVMVYDPQGKRIARTDVTGGGWEFIHFESSQPGAYRIELTAGGQSGPYAIRLDRIEPSATSLEGKLEQWVRFLQGHERPGGAVALVSQGDVTYAGAFGLADLTHRIPFTTDTPSNIGSVSKPLTAFAVALLEKEGKLSVDDDVRTYLPDLPDFGQPITLRHLLTHTAGLRELYWLLSMQGRVPGRWTREDLIGLVQQQRGLASSPGEVMKYTNTAYVLLAEVVESVTGVSFAEWMEANVFEPLAMNRTTVKTREGEVIPNSARGYAGRRGQQQPIWTEGQELNAFYGATGVYTTVGDLARWVANLGAAQVGGPEVVSWMTERAVLTSGDTIDYGRGLFVGSESGLRRYYHTGEDGDHFAAFYYYPEADVGMVYLSNTRLYSLTLESIAEDLFVEERVAEEAPEPDPTGIQEVAPVEIDPALLDEYTGHYGDEGPGLIVVFSREDRHMSVEVGSWWWEPHQVTLLALSDSTFTNETQGVRFIFRRDLEGNVDRVIWGGGIYRRMTPYLPSEEDLTAFAGRYYSEELGVVYALHLEEGRLRLTNPHLQGFPARPWEPDVFRSVYPLTELRFTRGRDGEVTGFVATNGVLFKKMR